MSSSSRHAATVTRSARPRPAGVRGQCHGEPLRPRKAACSDAEVCAAGALRVGRRPVPLFLLLSSPFFFLTITIKVPEPFTAVYYANLVRQDPVLRYEISQTDSSSSSKSGLCCSLCQHGRCIPSSFVGNVHTIFENNRRDDAQRPRVTQAFSKFQVSSWSPCVCVKSIHRITRESLQ